EGAEDVVVAGGGVVLLDDGRRVQARDAAVGQVQPAALPQPRGAAGPCRPAVGLVGGDRARPDRDARLAVGIDAAAEAVATVRASPPGAAGGRVAAEGGAAHGEGRPPEVGERAAQTVAAVLPTCSLAADGLVAAEGAARDGRRGPPAVVDGAAEPLV